MSKLMIGALVAMLALTGCGSAGSTSGSSGPATSSRAATSAARPSTRAVPTTTPTRSTSTTTATTPARSTSSPTPASPPAPDTTSGTVGFTTVPRHVTITPQDIAKAKRELPACRANDAGITLEQLEKEAASPEGIQC